VCEKVNQIQTYALDLTKLDGSGAFSCPQCGTVIAPDDCTEEAYSILEAKVDNQGLIELVIGCNACGSQVQLTGFSLLQKIEAEKFESDEKKENAVLHYSYIAAPKGSPFLRGDNTKEEFRCLWCETNYQSMQELDMHARVHYACASRDYEEN
jgi:transcription elongation factor Elf1